MTQRTWLSQFHSRWMVATVVSIVCVLGLTHIPQQAIPRALQRDLLDKVEHVAAYGLITGFFLLSLRRPVRPVLLVLGLAILAAIGALDEMTQPLVNRIASVSDYAGDLTGMVIACVIFLMAGWPKRRMKCDG